jgi:general secretion pathway protein H
MPSAVPFPTNPPRVARGFTSRGFIPRGFTLIELVVVIMLIAIASAIAAGLMSAGLPGQQLRGASRELAAQLRFARAQAIVSGEPQVFALDTATREWTGPKRHHGSVPAAIQVIAVGARDEQASPSLAAYRFFPDGASTGGHIRLKRNDAEWRLDIDWLTGTVTVTRGDARP